MERIHIWDVKSPPVLSSYMHDHLDVVTSIGGGCVLSFYHIEKTHGWVALLSDTASDGSDSGENLSDWSLFFWVSPPYRAGLCGMKTLIMFGKHTIQLDLSQFVHGTAWMQCYSPCLGVIQLSPNI